ncbi:MAG: O-antigen ligase family protein [Acidimicrobiales bacterium]
MPARRATLPVAPAAGRVEAGRPVAVVRRRARLWRRAAVRGALVVVVTIALVQLGKLALDQPVLALALAGVVVVAVLAVTDPLAIALLSLLGVWVIARTGAGGVDLSGSDALLVLGAVVAFPLAPWANPSLRRVLGAVLVFQAVLFVTVLASPTPASLFEWGHRFFLTGGSVVVGAALAARGRTRSALGAFVVVTSVMGALTAGLSVAGGFAPTVAILGFHKNFIGSMMLVGLVVSHLAPASTGLSRHQLAVAKGVCVAGLLASQSRGAIVALLVALIVATVGSRDVRRRSAPLFVVLVPLALFAFFSIRSQVEQPADATSSVTERARFREQGLEAWEASPVLGQGMRFFEQGELALTSDPHNVVVSSLSETGVVGLAALVGLLAVTARVLWRIRTGLALAALAVVVARFTHGLFDVYWVAGTQALPWMIVGMALADAGAAGDRQGADRPSDRLALARHDRD